MNEILGFLGIGMTCVISIIVTVWCIGIDRETRRLIISFVKNKFKRLR